jgi:NAD(P)-dependent dehydrogenase (short-subunit alcohol dehydrogenase family)
MNLAGKVALVTGGGRGLGRGMALALAEAGAGIAVVSRTEGQIRETVGLIERGGGTAWAIPWSLGDPREDSGLVDQVVRRAGRLDVLVHAAGHQVRRPALELTADEWDGILTVHLRSAFLLAQAAARHMMGRGGGGSIVLIGSLTSWRVGVPHTAAYAAAKSGMVGMMRTLAVEWAEEGVRVNTIAPGFFATELTRDVEADPGRRRLLARIPMGRQGTPQDLGGAVVFLASDASAYLTGQVITVDGGWSAA